MTRHNNAGLKYNITTETGICHIKPPAPEFHTRILNDKVLRGEKSGGFSLLIAVENLPCCDESIAIASSTTYTETMNTQSVKSAATEYPWQTIIIKVYTIPSMVLTRCSIALYEWLTNAWLVIKTKEW